MIELCPSTVLAIQGGVLTIRNLRALLKERGASVT